MRASMGCGSAMVEWCVRRCVLERDVSEGKQVSTVHLRLAVSDNLSREASINHVACDVSFSGQDK